MNTTPLSIISSPVMATRACLCGVDSRIRENWLAYVCEISKGKFFCFVFVFVFLFVYISIYTYVVQLLC